MSSSHKLGVSRKTITDGSPGNKSKLIRTKSNESNLNKTVINGGASTTDLTTRAPVSSLLPPLGNLKLEDLYCFEKPEKLLPFIPPVNIIGFDDRFEENRMGVGTKTELVTLATVSPTNYPSQNVSPVAGSPVAATPLISRHFETGIPDPTWDSATLTQTSFIDSLYNRTDLEFPDFVGHTIKQTRCTDVENYFSNNRPFVQQPQTFSPRHMLTDTRALAAEYKKFGPYDINSKFDTIGFKFSAPDIPDPNLMLSGSDQTLVTLDRDQITRNVELTNTNVLTSPTVTATRICGDNTFDESGSSVRGKVSPDPLLAVSGSPCLETQAYSPGEVFPQPTVETQLPMEVLCPEFERKFHRQSAEACIGCTEEEKALFSSYDFTREPFDELRESYFYFAAPNEMLHVSDFGKSLRAIGQNPSEDDIRKMLTIASVDPTDDYITIDRYLKAVACWGLKSDADMIEDLVEALKVFEVNEDEQLDIKNLYFALLNYGEPLDEQEAQELLQFGKSETADEKPSFEKIAKRLTAHYLPLNINDVARNSSQ